MIVENDDYETFERIINNWLVNFDSSENFDSDKVCDIVIEAVNWLNVLINLIMNWTNLHSRYYEFRLLYSVTFYLLLVRNSSLLQPTYSINLTQMNKRTLTVESSHLLNINQRNNFLITTIFKLSTTTTITTNISLATNIIVVVIINIKCYYIYL